MLCNSACRFAVRQRVDVKVVAQAEPCAWTVRVQNADLYHGYLAGSKQPPASA